MRNKVAKQLRKQAEEQTDVVAAYNTEEVKKFAGLDFTGKPLTAITFVRALTDDCARKVYKMFKKDYMGVK